MRLKDSKGQIVVEYVLLLVIAVGVAFIITTTLVSRNPESPGFLMQKWRDIIETIASDNADNPGGEKCRGKMSFFESAHSFS